MRNTATRTRHPNVPLALAVIFVTAAAATAGAAPPGFVNVRKHLPATWATDGSVDLREPIRKVLNAHAMVFFPGSDDPARPLIYPFSAQVVVRNRCEIRFGANAWVKRLPSSGRLIRLHNGARMSGGVIDGNKYAHWPKFKNLGKTDAAVETFSNCVVEDVTVFNSPGIAFFSYGSYNKIYRCRAENIGYIDVKFGADFYQGKWDNFSGDGFYFRGTGNLIKDCEAYDCFRWDYCSSHSGARQNTYVDCKGGDVNWGTYGFIDIEGADENNRLIRCTSPNSPLVASGSPRLDILQCMASLIFVRGGDAPRIDGCITTRDGISVGGWDPGAKKNTPGPAAPMVTNNRMYRMGSGRSGGFGAYFRRSFAVHSADGSGVVAGNILFEYDDGKKRGPGMKLDNIKGRDNRVVYGRWDLKLAKPSLRYGYVDRKVLERRRRGKAMERLKRNKQSLGIAGRIDSVRWLDAVVPFAKDDKDQGQSAGWASAVPRGKAKIFDMRISSHWSRQHGGSGFRRFRGPGWYYFTFDWPALTDGRAAYPGYFIRPAGADVGRRGEGDRQLV